VATPGGNAASSAQDEAQTERIAERMEIEYTSGVVIGGVQDASPAAEAGLQHGDVLADIDGELMETVRQVVTTIQGLALGTVVALTILRDGDELVIEATLAGQPDPQPDNSGQRQQNPLPDCLWRIIGNSLPGNLLHAQFELLGGDGQVITIDLTAGRVQTATDVSLIIVRKDDMVVEFEADDETRVIVGGYRIDLSGFRADTLVLVVEKDGRLDLVLAWPATISSDPCRTSLGLCQSWRVGSLLRPSLFLMALCPGLTPTS
jgi:hypothetical protein